MSPGRLPENGADAEEEERNEAARAHADFDRVPRAEAMRIAFVEARMAKDGFHRAATDMLGGLGALAGEVSGVREQMGHLGARVESGFESVSARLEEIEKHRGRRRRDPDDSLVDVYEQLPPDVAERVSSSRAHDIDAIVQLREQVEALAQEKHDRDVKDKAVAEHEARDAAKLEARRKARGDLLRTLVALTALAGFLYGVAQVALPHLK